MMFPLFTVDADADVSFYGLIKPTPKLLGSSSHTQHK